VHAVDAHRRYYGSLDTARSRVFVAMASLDKNLYKLQHLQHCDIVIDGRCCSRIKHSVDDNLVHDSLHLCAPTFTVASANVRGPGRWTLEAPLAQMTRFWKEISSVRRNKPVVDDDDGE
jgi:hypothetical protein